MALTELKGQSTGTTKVVIERGPVLAHGQTFGPSANDKWRITHEPSELVDGRDAIVLAIP